MSVSVTHYKSLNLDRDPGRVRSALAAADAHYAGQGFAAEQVTHAILRNDYVYLYMSPVAVLINQACKAACEVRVQGEVTEPSCWYTGRSNTEPDAPKPYERDGFYRRNAAQEALLSFVDKALRETRPLPAELAKFSGGLAALAAEHHVFVLERRNEHTVQAMRYDNENDRLDFIVDCKTGRIRQCWHTLLEPALE